MYEPHWFEWPYARVNLLQRANAIDFCAEHFGKPNERYTWCAWINDGYVAGIEIHFMNDDDLLFFKIAFNDKNEDI